MPLIRHPKRRGEWVELQFMARAASHGLTVSKPWGDSARYDFIVDHCGRLSRVQVKSTTFNSGGFYMCNTVSRPPNRPSESYSPEQIDFFAAFIIPEDIWYIVPAEIIRTTRFAVSLHPQRRDNKYFRYMESWHLLRRPATDKQG